MGKFKITYGLGGSYNTRNEEIVECATLEDAIDWAYESAMQEFDSYGVFKCCAEGCEEQTNFEDCWHSEFESWARYNAEEII